MKVEMPKKIGEFKIAENKRNDIKFDLFATLFVPEGSEWFQVVTSEFVVVKGENYWFVGLDPKKQRLPLFAEVITKRVAERLMNPDIDVILAPQLEKLDKAFESTTIKLRRPSS